MEKFVCILIGLIGGFTFTYIHFLIKKALARKKITLALLKNVNEELTLSMIVDVLRDW